MPTETPTLASLRSDWAEVKPEMQLVEDFLPKLNPRQLAGHLLEKKEIDGVRDCRSEAIMDAYEAANRNITGRRDVWRETMGLLLEAV